MDKKLTDAEIIKGLKYHSNHFCTDADYQNMIKLALDLINRLQAENEALIAGQETLQKYIAEQKAEIERLKVFLLERRTCSYCKHKDKKPYQEPCDMCKGYDLYEQLITEKEIKAEAYKECIEEVKKELSLIRLGCQNLLDNEGVFAIDLARKQVDNLLKELVDNNG